MVIKSRGVIRKACNACTKSCTVAPDCNTATCAFCSSALICAVGTTTVAPSEKGGGWAIVTSGNFSSQAQERKNLSIIATIACRVVEVSPTGLLRIEGSQEFTIDKRKQTVKLSGWVRPSDISPNNTVLSTQVADARLEFKGDWKTRQGKGFLERLLEGFNRILRVLF